MLGGWTVVEGPGWFIAANREDCIAQVGERVVASPAPHLIDRAQGRRLSLHDACERLTQTGSALLDDLAPPYRLLTGHRGNNRVEAHFDHFGLGHMFEGRKGDTLFTSSSVRLVAEAIGARPDIAALLGYSQIGVFPFSATPYEGVLKLLPGDAWGEEYAEPRKVVPLHTLQHEVETSFREAVQALLTAAPDASLELSGGLDSRLILAALTPEQRRGRAALTLGSPGEVSQDLLIASRLSSANDLAHRISQPPSSPWEDPEALFATLETACLGYQCMGNPVDKATLLANGDDSEGLSRFSGQNGEILRGFYHAMQPLGARASDALWASLTDWRLIANDRVPARFLSDHACDEAIPAARKSFLAELSQFDGEWGQVIDRLYLRLRMQAWVGNAASSNLVKRTMLMPFFDRQFVKAAMALPAAARSNSHAAYRLLADIDPVLAAVPLDSGSAPADILNPGLGTKLAGLRRNAGKLATKLGQRLRPRPGTALGGAAIVEAWHHHRGFERLDMERLAALGIFDPAMLEALQSGQATPDRSELGFLLVCNNL